MPIPPLLRPAAAALLLTLAAAAPGPLFEPVFREDFADPFILEHRGTFIAYATNKGVNLPIALSKDLVRWEALRDSARPKQLHDGMPELGAWAKTGLTWAPEVMEVGGRWNLYYTARDRKRDLQCIGLAIATDPRGPFRDTAAEPLVCQTELGGTIDANPFRDRDGKLYLYYKNDGNAVRKPTTIWGQRLSADGAKLEGEPVAMLRNDKPWEEHVVEAPSMVLSPGGHTMFFSARHYGWEPHQPLSVYSMGYARCLGPLGPCTDAPENPILSSYKDRKAGCLSGPGHQAVFQARGRLFIAFHAWSATAGCRPLNKGRYLYVAPLGWKDGKPQVGRGLKPVSAGKAVQPPS